MDDNLRARQIPQDVFQKYQQLKQTYTVLAQKLAEFDADKSEHEYACPPQQQLLYHVDIKN